MVPHPRLRIATRTRNGDNHDIPREEVEMDIIRMVSSESDRREALYPDCCCCNRVRLCGCGVLNGLSQV